MLETRRITRVGSTREVDVDVRIIAATHRDLERMVEEGLFREDLLFRLNTFTLRVPPLRERLADLPPLATRFLAKMRESGQTSVSGFSDDAMAALLRHAWPGNVRELRNAVDYAGVIACGPKIEVADLPERVRRQSRREPSVDVGPPVSSPPASQEAYNDQMRRAERAILTLALKRAGGTQAEAAKLLDMPLRTLKYRLKLLDLRRADYEA